MQRGLIGLLGLLLALLPGLLLAYDGHDGPIQTFTQAVGPYELAISIEKPTAVPAPLYIDIAPQQALPVTRLSLRAVPRGRSFEAASLVELTMLPGTPIIYSADLPLDQFGDWELEVRATGPEGSGLARIPFTVTRRTLAGPPLALLAALAGGLGLLLAGAGVSALERRRGRTAPAWRGRLLGQGALGCLVVVLVLGGQQLAGVLSAGSASLVTPGNLALLEYGRPHVNVRLTTEPALPQANQPFSLTLQLSDGSTGLPVDDLETHHDALMHLVVVSADGGYFAHVHPARLAPGRFAVALTPDRAGHYRAYVELVRQDSGTQLITRDFEVTGPDAGAEPFAASGPGRRQLGDLEVMIDTSSQPRAGRQTTLRFSFRQHGQPVVDLQPWLGMAGHLIARNEDGQVFSHVHAAEAMAPVGTAGLSAVYGPDVRFAYSFPQPGRYQVWAQFRHQHTVLTIPLTLEVVE